MILYNSLTPACAEASAGRHSPSPKRGVYGEKYSSDNSIVIG